MTKRPIGISIIKFMAMTTIILSTYLSANEFGINLDKIKLPARNQDIVLDQFSIDSNLDSIIENYEITVDISEFSIQKIQSISANELLLDEPRFSNFNTNIIEFSIINKPIPVFAALCFENIAWNAEQGISLFSGEGLLSVNTLSLEPIIEENNNFEHFSLLEYASAENFKFAVSKSNEIAVYDHNLISPHWIHTSTNKIQKIKRIQFDIDSNFEVLVVFDNLIKVLDDIDGSVIWSADYSLKDVHVGNFDEDPLDEFIAENNTGLTNQLNLFDSEQFTPVWTYVGDTINDLSIHDIDDNGIDEMTIIEEPGLISRLNSTGEVISFSNVLNPSSRLLTVGHINEDNEFKVITDEQVFDVNLMKEVETFDRKYKAYDEFFIDRLDLNGEERSLSVRQGDIQNQYFVEIVDINTGLLISSIEVFDLAIKNDSFEYSVTAGQLDDDESLEIITLSYDEQEKSHMINVYDSLTLQNQSSTTLPLILLLGEAFQIVAADKDGDGLDQVYLFYHQSDSSFRIMELNHELDNASWDSSQSNIRFSAFGIERRVVVENIDGDLGEELVFAAPWNLWVLDLNTKMIQVHENYLFSHLVVQNIEGDYKGYGISGGSSSSLLKVFDLSDGNFDNQVSINIPFVRYVHLIEGSIYLIVGQDRIYTYDAVSNEILDSSHEISFDEVDVTEILVQQSSVNQNLFYLGNNFGLWKVFLTLPDFLFGNGFE